MQAIESGLEVWIFLGAKAERRVIRAETLQAGEYGLDTGFRGDVREVGAEFRVNGFRADGRARAQVNREVIADKGVEFGAILRAERRLDRLPVILVEPGLSLLVETHQDKIPDQVRGREVEPGAVQALENHLRVVLTPRQADVDHNELLDSFVDGLNVRAGHMLFEELEIVQKLLRETVGWRLAVEQSRQRCVVRPAKVELVAAISFSVAIAKVVIVERVWGGCIFAAVVGLRLEPSAQRQQDERERGEPLLPVDQKPAGKVGRVVLGRDVNDGTEKMASRVIVTADADDVVPKGEALFGAPAIVALKDRHNELLGSIKQRCDRNVFCIH